MFSMFLIIIINDKGTEQWLQNFVYKFCPLSSRFLFSPSSSRERVRRLSAVDEAEGRINCHLLEIESK